MKPAAEAVTPVKSAPAQIQRSPAAPQLPVTALSAPHPVVTAVPPAASAADRPVGRCSTCAAIGDAGGGAPGAVRTGVGIPRLGQTLNSVVFSAARLIDNVGIWLSTLPGSMIDFVAGGLWMVRRTILPVGSDVGLWGSASCVATKDCSGRDLSGADLHGQDLSGTDFAGASLRRADLAEALLTVANLTSADAEAANLVGVDLSGATLVSADLSSAALAGADLTNADLSGVNLSGADLSRATLEGAGLDEATLTGVIWRNTTCPDGSKSSSGCSALPPLLGSAFGNGKPGLIASDWLTVKRETGEKDGDELILLTTTLATTLGYPNSSRVWTLDETPGQVASGVDAGERVEIPNGTGDNWIRYRDDFKPLSLEALRDAARAGQPLPIPVIVIGTFAAEGDFSKGSGYAKVVDEFRGQLWSVATRLEQARILKAGSEVVNTLNAALDVLREVVFALKLGPYPYGPAAELANRLETALRLYDIDKVIKTPDPDDSVSFGLTALIPVEQDVVDLLAEGGGPRQLGSGFWNLGDDYMTCGGAPGNGWGCNGPRAKTQKLGPPWNLNIPMRAGLLVPPKQVNGNWVVQSWKTTFVGDSVENKEAEWVVETQAWPRASWANADNFWP